MKNVSVCAFVCIGILAAWHRERLAAQSGGPVSGPYHDSTAEVYIVLSGSGVLTTGGTITDKKPSANYNLLNGPGGNGVPARARTAAACSRATSSSSHRASCTCGRRSPGR